MSTDLIILHMSVENRLATKHLLLMSKKLLNLLLSVPNVAVDSL